MRPAHLRSMCASRCPPCIEIDVMHILRPCVIAEWRVYVGWYDEGQRIGLEELIEKVLCQFHAKLRENLLEGKICTNRVNSTHEGGGVGREGPTHSRSETPP